MATSLKADAVFTSFAEFENLFKRYRDTNKCEYWKRDSRTVVAFNRGRSEEKRADPKLVYGEILFCCVHGGETYRYRGGGQRQSRTLRQQCPAHIRLRATKDGKNLRVSSISEEHNHEISEELYSHLPHQRRLSLAEREEACRLLGMNSSKKEVQAVLSQRTGKVITLKDLKNIASVPKKPCTNNLSFVEMLKNTYSATVEVLTDKNKTLTGLFFQDPEMRETYSAYPEVLWLDTSCRLLKPSLPVYLMLCLDGCGQVQVASVAIFTSETKASLEWMMRTLKSHNPSWSQTRALMVGLEVDHRHVISQHLPDASLLLPFYQTLRTFKRDVNADSKFGSTADEKENCFELFQKLAHAREKEYDRAFCSFKQSVQTSVVKYFTKAWQPIKEQWAVGHKFVYGSHLDVTNSRLEAFIHKLKCAIGDGSSLEKFIERFFAVVTAHRNGRHHLAAPSAQNAKEHGHPDGSPEQSYMHLLTSYAANFVVKQLHEKAEVRPTGGGQYLTNVDGLDISATKTTCLCLFHLCMELPCSHVFAVRRQEGEPTYDPSLCATRWRQAYYVQSKSAIPRTPERGGRAAVASLSEEPDANSPPERCARHQRVSGITLRLAELAAAASGARFQQRVETLERVLHLWEDDRMAEVFDVVEDPAPVETPVGEGSDTTRSPELQTSPVAEEDPPSTSPQHTNPVTGEKLEPRSAKNQDHTNTQAPISANPAKRKDALKDCRHNGKPRRKRKKKTL